MEVFFAFLIFNLLIILQLRLSYMFYKKNYIESSYLLLLGVLFNILLGVLLWVL